MPPFTSYKLDKMPDGRLSNKLYRVLYNVLIFISKRDQLAKARDYISLSLDFTSVKEWIDDYQNTVNKYIAENDSEKSPIARGRKEPIGCIHLEYDRIWLDNGVDSQIAIGQMIDKQLQMLRDLNPDIPCDKPVCDTLAITYNYISCGGDSNMVTGDAERTYRLHAPTGLQRLIIRNEQCRALEMDLSKFSAKEILCEIPHYHGKNKYRLHKDTELVMLYASTDSCKRIADTVMDINPDCLVYIGKAHGIYLLLIIRPSAMARLDHYLIRPVT